jgi:hypothetical protein
MTNEEQKELERRAQNIFDALILKTAELNGLQQTLAQIQAALKKDEQPADE